MQQTFPTPVIGGTESSKKSEKIPRSKAPPARSRSRSRKSPVARAIEKAETKPDAPPQDLTVETLSIMQRLSSFEAMDDGTKLLEDAESVIGKVRAAAKASQRIACGKAGHETAAFVSRLRSYYEDMERSLEAAVKQYTTVGQARTDPSAFAWPSSACAKGSFQATIRIHNREFCTPLAPTSNGILSHLTRMHSWENKVDWTRLTSGDRSVETGVLPLFVETGPLDIRETGDLDETKCSCGGVRCVSLVTPHSKLGEFAVVAPNPPFPGHNVFPQGWTREPTPTSEASDAVVFRRLNEGAPIFAYSVSGKISALVVSHEFSIATEVADAFIREHEGNHVTSFDSFALDRITNHGPTVRVFSLDSSELNDVSSELREAFIHISSSPTGFRDSDQVVPVLGTFCHGFADVQIEDLGESEDRIRTVGHVKSVTATSVGAAHKVLTTVLRAIAPTDADEMRVAVDYKPDSDAEWNEWVRTLIATGWLAPRTIQHDDQNVGIEFSTGNRAMCTRGDLLPSKMTKEMDAKKRAGLFVGAYARRAAVLIPVVGYTASIKGDVLFALMEEVQKVAQGNELRGFFEVVHSESGFRELSGAISAVETASDDVTAPRGTYSAPLTSVKSETASPFAFCARRTSRLLTRFDLLKAVQWSVNGMSSILVLSREGVSSIGATSVFVAFCRFLRAAARAEDDYVVHGSTKTESEARSWKLILNGILRAGEHVENRSLVDIYAGSKITKEEDASKNVLLAEGFSDIRFGDVMAEVAGFDLYAYNYVRATARTFLGMSEEDVNEMPVAFSTFLPWNQITPLTYFYPSVRLI